jgi:CRISPR type III-associated protein (TIGR04423 family)
MKKEEIIKIINNECRNFSGYVQFSHRPIDKSKDIFLNGDVKVEDESGFIYEAHFYSDTEKKSIQIKQINDSWLVSKTDISHINENDTQKYISDIEGFDYKIKMAQIWETKPDELCEGMEVKKLTKVVFVGFEKGESK